MASKSLASTALLLSLNLLFFTLVSSQPASPPTTPAPSPVGGCPRLGVCVKLLDDLATVLIGGPTNNQCCSLFPGTELDLQASSCLCVAIRVHALEVLHIGVDGSLGRILNYCGKTTPPDFRCLKA
ncbi:14 kDa proline-rich protein DC2.15-like [Diospyros lotus]|uniref:14 kDa proline-rich protein DC2.15-like n=1 Tax=Diospyros lotus TaxID=55363 RepID=UPI002257F93B|nr:14 kDa proline-rich protein DC2.15-like [Diospyros lotus]